MRTLKEYIHESTVGKFFIEDKDGNIYFRQKRENGFTEINTTMLEPLLKTNGIEHLSEIVKIHEPKNIILFDSREEAERVVKDLNRRWPDKEYRVSDIG